MIYNSGNGLFCLSLSLGGGGEVEVGVKVLAYLNKYSQCTSTPTGKLSALILTCGASLGQVENNKSEPLTLHSLSPYHSRQIVFTPDPTTATKDPTCSSNNSKSNHIGFPFLVSKGHSLS